MKTILLFATLTLLASCTKVPEPTPTPAPETKMIDETKNMPEDTMMKDEESKPDAMMKPDAAKPETMMQDDMNPTKMSGEMLDQSGMDMKEKDAMMMKPTGYIEYDEMKVSDALASGQKVVLFFHATWCPTCKALDKSINAEISTIPTDALIVKVDYDSSTVMKQKYGVTSQHTTVLIDRDMNLISKKLGAKSVSEVLD